MPSLTQHHQPLFSKKRMRDDSSDEHHHSDGELHVPLYADDHDHYQATSNFPADYLLRRSDELHHSAFNDHNDERYFQHGGNRGQPGVGGPRKIIPLPLAKKLRRTEWQGPDEIPSIQQQYDEAARQRSPRHINLSSPTPTKELQQTSGNSRPSTLLRTTTSAALLSPCHICHRRPTKKSDLDSYADCQGCGERTCYVCIRECLGWKTGQDYADNEVLRDRPPTTTTEEENLSASFHMEDAPCQNGHAEAGEADESGDRVRDTRTRITESWGQGGGGHRQMVCSRCCVERGPEGEVICLGCLEK